MSVCTPGQRLALATEREAGPGTHVKDGYVCASLVGIRREVPVADAQQKPTLEVVRSGAAPVVPAVGDVVTARVTRITPRLAAADILCVGSQPVQQRYSGIIRVQVWGPSTARNELGVVYACSVAGVPMVPISWSEMQCPRTKAVESRKVAKPPGEPETEAAAGARARGRNRARPGRRAPSLPSAAGKEGPPMSGDGGRVGGRAPQRIAFVTVGTTRFDALIRAVDQAAVADALAGKGYTRLVGKAEYKPHRLFPPNSRVAQLHSGLQARWSSVEYFDFAPSLAEHMEGAALVISHAGSGSIFETLCLRRPLIAVPNPLLMDDHQAELAAKLESMGHLVAATPDGLAAAIARLDEAALAPYEPGSPAGIVAGVDALAGGKAGGAAADGGGGAKAL
eukprot:scaffold6.g2579.t1